MKKELRTLILVCMALSVILTGCTGATQNAEQLFNSDTVVNIPLNPEPTETEAATEEVTVPEETEAETQAPTEATEETTAKKTTTTKSTSSKTTSSKSSSNKTTSNKTSTKATEPPATQPPETQPPVTEPEETAPLETEPPATEVPETEVPETEPPATQSPEEAVYDISDYAVGGLEYGIVEQINACRTAEGLEPLSMSGYLCGIASVRAYEVCLSWSHTRPNGSGWQSVLSDYGYGYSVAAEDLVHSAGFDAASIVGKWMGSDGSCADILSADFTTIGVGVYNAGGATFIAAIFVG